MPGVSEQFLPPGPGALTPLGSSIDPPGPVLAESLEKSRRIAVRLLSSDSVFNAMQRGFSATFQARKLFERNVVRVLSSANVPSRQDLARLIERLEDIDAELDTLVHRVDQATARLEQERRSERRN